MVVVVAVVVVNRRVEQFPRFLAGTTDDVVPNPAANFEVP
jgi:hypothetical protein